MQKYVSWPGSIDLACDVAWDRPVCAWQDTAAQVVQANKRERDKFYKWRSEEPPPDRGGWRRVRLEAWPEGNPVRPRLTWSRCKWRIYQRPEVFVFVLLQLQSFLLISNLVDISVIAGESHSRNKKNQQQMLSFLVMAMQSPGFVVQLIQLKESNWRVAEAGNMLELDKPCTDKEPKLITLQMGWKIFYQHWLLKSAHGWQKFLKSAHGW